MKKLLFIFGFVFFFLVGQAQMERFNVRNDFGYPGSFLTSVLPTDSCYFATGVVIDSIAPHNFKSLFVKYDLEGNLLFFKTEGNPSIEIAMGAPTLQPYTDSTFLVSGYVFEWEDTTIHTMKGVILHFNYLGDTLWMKKYLSPVPLPLNNGFFRPMDFLFTSDGGSVLLSWSHNNNQTISGITLQKLGANFEIEWEHIHGSVKDDVPYSIQETADGGYVIGASISNSNVAGNPPPESFSSLKKLDNLGNLEWEWQSPDLEYWGGNRDILTLPDKSLLLATGINTMNPGYDYHPFLTKLDSNQNMVWGTEFFETEYANNNRFVKVVAASDNSGFIATGITYYFNTDDQAWDVVCRISKVDNDGNALWNRFHLNVEGPQNYHEIYDLRETPDKGYVLCGQAGSSTVLPLQQAWLLKLDEYGCLVPGCQLFDNVEEVEAKEQLPSILLYPNPTSDYLYLFCESGTQALEGTFRIIDTQGLLLQYFEKRKVNMTYEVNVSGYASGIYYLVYEQEDGYVETISFVVE